MTDSAAISYISEQVRAGKKRDEIKANLVSNGWTQQAAEEALVIVPAHSLPNGSAPSSGGIMGLINEFPQHKFVLLGIMGLVVLLMSIAVFSMLIGNNTQKSQKSLQAGSSSIVQTAKDQTAVIPTQVPTLSATVPNDRDEQRKGDMLKILMAMQAFYKVKAYYPSSFASLLDHGDLSSIPADPLTNKPYEYTVPDDGNSFSLCVQYEVKGRTCYDQKILLNLTSFNG